MQIATGDLSSFIQHGAFVTTPVLEDQPSVDTASSKVLRSAASMMESVQTRVMHVSGVVSMIGCSLFRACSCRDVEFFSLHTCCCLRVSQRQVSKLEWS